MQSPILHSLARGSILLILAGTCYADTCYKYHKRAPVKSVCGRIINPIGQEPAGVELSLTNESASEPLIAKVDGKGRFAFGPVPHGDYTLRAVAPGFVQEERQLRVTENLAKSCKPIIEVKLGLSACGGGTFVKGFDKEKDLLDEDKGHNVAAREGRIPVGGAELYFREIGKGTPVIVLHGGPDFDSSYLLPEMDSFDDSFRLIYYDQRGRGRSAAGVRPEDVSIESEMADLDKVREHFQLKKVVLLGHSWGTVLALEYAIRHPERVSRLVIMNPAPASAGDLQQFVKERQEKWPELMEKRKAIAATTAYKEADPDAVVAYYRIHFTPALARHEDYEKLITRMQASFARQGNAGILKARAIEDRLVNETWAKPDYDLMPKLKDLKIPTLVIYSDHDFIPATTAEHIAQAIPGARMVTLKDCGHFPYMECPVPLRERMDAFFRGK